MIPECVYNIWTNGTGEIISGRILCGGDGSPLAGAVVTAARSGGGTYTATSNARGIYALAQTPSCSGCGPCAAAAPTRSEWPARPRPPATACPSRKALKTSRGSSPRGRRCSFPAPAPGRFHHPARRHQQCQPVFPLEHQNLTHYATHRFRDGRPQRATDVLALHDRLRDQPGCAQRLLPDERRRTLHPVGGVHGPSPLVDPENDCVAQPKQHLLHRI